MNTNQGIANFETFFTKLGENDCWFWMGATIKGARGRYKFRGKTWLASRVSFTLYKGPIPKGLNVLHRCDNPSCVNPKHLFLGTQADNMQDAWQKGRIDPKTCFPNQKRNYR